MIIDFHTHTFPEKIAARALDKLKHASHSEPFTGGTTDELVRSMNRNGIDLSIILPVATSAHQVEHINDSAVQLNEAYREQGIHSFGGIHPDFEGWKAELARIKELGLKGIKLHPVYQDVDLDDPRFLRILDRCAELGLIVVTHAGYDIGFPGICRSMPEQALRAAKAIGEGNPGYQFVLAHMGGWKCWEKVMQLLPETGVMLDTAFSEGMIVPLADDDVPGYWTEDALHMLNSADFEAMVRLFGAERILFATDSPWSDQGESRRFIENTSLSAEEKEQIFGGNAQRLLGLG